MKILSVCVHIQYVSIVMGDEAAYLIDGKAVCWTLEKLFYSRQRQEVFLFPTCTPSLGSPQSHHGLFPLE
jgi:hypothetical protein